jgi:hypothetical protein
MVAALHSLSCASDRIFYSDYIVPLLYGDYKVVIFFSILHDDRVM